MPTLALFTPILIPDLHDLAMMLRADHVVINDMTSFSRKSREHRCRVRNPEGAHWLRVPIRRADRHAPLHTVRLDADHKWVDDWMRVLQLDYRNSIYFDFYEPEIHADLQHAASLPFLIEAVEWIWERLFTYFYLDISWKRTSTMDSYDPDPDLFKRNLNCNLLWQEHDSKSYMRQSNQGDVMKFDHPVYHQHFEGFEPYCCLLDVLFQFGPTAWQLFDRLKGVEDMGKR